MTLPELAPELSALAQRLRDAEGYLGIAAKRARLDQLEGEVARPDLWDDADAARAVTTEYGRIKDDVGEFDRLQGKLDDALTLHELAMEEGDESVEAEIRTAIADLAKEIDSLELQSLFSGEYDSYDAIVSIQAGEGGTDAQDWAEMMVRMYSRWAERRGFKVDIDEVSEGQEAGILSATFVIHGRNAFGLLDGERGVHRLYRISPFDSQARRQTSYAAVDVVPLMEDVGEVQVDEKDIRVDTYRASGAGGQHVNKTDSAIRITHIPTGIVVSCQNERSQLQNRAKAMQNLVSRLAQLQREERQKELAAISGDRGAVSRAGQFQRGYVLAPYQQVKDERTGHETGNVQAVLDGDLDAFMEAHLKWRRSGDDEK